MTGRAALILAVVALVAAMGGTAVGARLITGKDIRDRSITAADLRTKAVTGRVAHNLTGRDIQRDSLDGSDIAEETLDVRRARAAGRADTSGRADSAATADALSGGVTERRVIFTGVPGADVTVLELAGLKLRATCSATSALALTATTSATASSWIRVGGQRSTGSAPAAVFAEDDDFRAGESFDALAGSPDNLSAQLTYVSSTGAVVTVELIAEQGVALTRGHGCLVAGTATHAPA
jgi:hypothetical protein